MKKKLWQLGLTLMSMGFVGAMILFAASVIATPSVVDWVDRYYGLLDVDMAVPFVVAMVIMVIGVLICAVLMSRELTGNDEDV